MERFAIVGFGCAGYNALRAIRKNGFEGEVHIYFDNDKPPANPMLTTYYASGRIPYEAVFPFGDIDHITKEFDAILHQNTQVERIDDKTKSLIFKDGTQKTFDKILIATGASVFVPPIKNECIDKTFYMRTIDDAIKLKDTIEKKPPKSVVVIGASMVGIKLVEMFYNAGIQCTLADMAPYIFPLAAFEDVAKIIEGELEKKGIDMKFSSGLESIEQPGNVCFSDGSKLPADIIILSIGTRANTGLVKETGIVVNRGIVVNDHMETSVPGIYAAGDCCEGTNIQSGDTQIIGLWANAGLQGETAGNNIAGNRTHYEGNIIHNITHFMDMDFISFGDNRKDGQVFTFFTPESGRYIKAIVNKQNHRLECINIMDNCRISGIVKNYMMKRYMNIDEPLTPSLKGMLFKLGMNEEFIDVLEGKAV